MKSKNKILLALAVFGYAFIALAHAQDASYSIKQQFELGAPSRWDYTDIDPVRHRLFLSRADRVQVLDLPDGKVVGEIANTAGVHGVAFAQDLKLGFTSNGASNSITVFDLDTLAVKQDIKIPGRNPDAILYDEPSHKLYTFNGKSNDVTVIDAKTFAIIATIPATGKPEFAVSDGAGKIYFNIEDHPGVEVINIATNTIEKRWKLVGCDEPTGIAMDIANQRLFSSCRNQILAVSDAKTGARIAEVAIGQGPDAVVYDKDLKTIFTSNGGGNGSLTVIKQDDANHYHVVSTPATLKGARTMAMDSITKHIYLPTVADKIFRVLVIEATAK